MGMQFNINFESLCMELGVSFLQSIQDQSFSNSIINQGINNQSGLLSTLLFQRYIIEYNPREFDPNTHRIQHNDMNGMNWIIAATDGSAKNGKASAAGTFGPLGEGGFHLSPINETPLMLKS